MILCIGTTPAAQRTMRFRTLIRDEVNRAVEVRDYASGKGVNVARVLGVLGRPAVTLGFAGGARGVFLLAELAREGIAADFVPIDAQTRLCVSLIDEATGEATELVEEAPAASPGEWDDLTSRIDGHASEAEMLVFSGTIAPGAPEGWLEQWLGREIPVLIDAKGAVMAHALVSAGPVVAKLNREEFEQTLGERFGDDESLAEAVRRHAPRDGALIVTTGSSGAVASAGGEVLRVIAPRVNALSAIGSGDAFAAGLAAGLTSGRVFSLAGERFADALRLACACGAANALNADSGDVRRAEVDDLLTRVEIR